MTQSLKQLLDEQHVNSNTVQQTARYYLAERTDDLTPDEMRQQLVEATGDATAVDTIVGQFRQSPLLLENASLFLLSSAWEEPDERERIAKSKCKTLVHKHQRASTSSGLFREACVRILCTLI